MVPLMASKEGEWGGASGTIKRRREGDGGDECRERFHRPLTPVPASPTPVFTPPLLSLTPSLIKREGAKPKTGGMGKIRKTREWNGDGRDQES